MEKKNIVQYLILFLLVFIGILGLINFFKASGNLKNSKKTLENVLLEVQKSNTLLHEQAATIKELQQMNEELTKKVNEVDSSNTLIKKNLDASFRNANRNISDIKKSLEKIPEIRIN